MLKISEFQLSQFRRIFGGRRDCYAIQQPDGSYLKLDAVLSLDKLRQHLDGQITLAIYPLIKLGEKSLAKLICFDLDFLDKDGLRNLIYLLRAHGVPPECMLLEYTGGRGYHLWMIFNRFYPSEPIYWVARFFSQNFRYAGMKLEFFPKQPKLDQGYSSPIKLPLGIHRKTGKRSVFISSLEDFDHSCYGFQLEQQLQMLSQLRLLDPRDWIPSPPLDQWLQLKLEQRPEHQIFGMRFPQGIKPSCIQFLEQGVPVSLRNLQLSGLAIYYKDQGLDQRSTLERLLQINARNRPPEAQHVISSVVRSIFSYDKHWSCSYFRQELGLRSLGRLDPAQICDPWNCSVRAMSPELK